MSAIEPNITCVLEYTESLTQSQSPPIEAGFVSF
jgi:hypothetical protein